MIESTFIHIPFIGRKTEDRWWRLGVRTWDHLEEDLGLLVKTPARRGIIAQTLNESRDMRQVPLYFHRKLPAKHRWRLFGDFCHSVCYLDIETNGQERGFAEVTVVGVFNGRDYRAFISGHDIEGFQDMLLGCKLIVTFNGTLFDLPVLARAFPGFDPAGYAHLDLRFILGALGIKGGLKEVEERLGIARPERVRGLGGFDAVRLWREYLAGGSEPLETLVAYNREDVVNLKALMEKAFELHMSRLPLARGNAA